MRTNWHWKSAVINDTLDVFFLIIMLQEKLMRLNGLSKKFSLKAQQIPEKYMAFLNY